MKNYASKKKKKHKINQRTPLSLFVRSSLKILKILFLNFFFFQELLISFDKYQKYLFKCCILSEKFFGKNLKSPSFSEKYISSNNTKILPAKNKGGTLKLTQKTKNIGDKKNYLLKHEIKFIRIFLSNNLGKLTSSLDLNINTHLDLIEQVSDHSINIKRSSDKIQLKIRSIKSTRKKFSLIEIKIFCFTLFAFFLCYFL